MNYVNKLHVYSSNRLQSHNKSLPPYNKAIYENNGMHLGNERFQIHKTARAGQYIYIYIYIIVNVIRDLLLIKTLSIGYNVFLKAHLEDVSIETRRNM